MLRTSEKNINMASKRAGDEDNNGHSAVGDGPDTKKAKSVSASF